MDKKQLITTEEVCKLLKIHRMTLFRWLKMGAPCVQIGPRQRRFDYQELLNWLHAGGAKK